MARIVRAVAAEHGVDPEGAAPDPELASLARAYAAPGARFFVCERDGVVVGGCGFAPLREGAGCELRKMYLLPEARGLGLGARLLARCLAAARDAGYTHCWLQTTASMRRARALYAEAGFATVAPPDGEPPSRCEIWLRKAI